MLKKALLDVLKEQYNHFLTSRSISLLHLAELLNNCTLQVPINLLSSLAATYSPLGIRKGTVRLCILFEAFKKFHL